MTNILTRSGIGFDTHCVEQCKNPCEIVICGVVIKSNYKILAHSDGDVGIHAIIDALLGSVAIGDIGEHFPESAVEQGSSSHDMLIATVAKIQKLGFKIHNCDVTIIAQEPRISKHKDNMRDILATGLSIEKQNISVKATTTDGAGFLGRIEGIAAIAVVTTYKQSI